MVFSLNEYAVLVCLLMVSGYVLRGWVLLRVCGWMTVWQWQSTIPSSVLDLALMVSIGTALELSYRLLKQRWSA